MPSMKNKSLINENYKGNKENVLLKQYEIFVESSEKISLKRMSANTWYAGLNTALFAVAGYTSILSNKLAAIIMSVLGILLCLAWMTNISSYKRLNSAKFKVIHELEEHLPARPFTREDNYLNGHYKLAKVEKYIPYLFILAYILTIVYLFGGISIIWT